MRTDDEWSGLAYFLADMIAKYAGDMDLDSLPEPNRYYYEKYVREMYMKYMRLSSQRRKESGIKFNRLRRQSVIP